MTGVHSSANLFQKFVLDATRFRMGKIWPESTCYPAFEPLNVRERVNLIRPFNMSCPTKLSGEAG